MRAFNFKAYSQPGRAGFCALGLGAVSVLFIGSKLGDMDLSMIAALMAIVFGYMAKDGRNKTYGLAGASFGVFVLVNVLIYDPLLKDFFSDTHSIGGLEFNFALILILLLIIMSLLYVMGVYPPYPKRSKRPKRKKR